MKQSLLFLVFLSITSLVIGQSNYDRGFQAGYSKGYCQDQGVGCLSPLPPIAPIPKIGESLESYSDGYNRGFQMGLAAQTSNGNSNRQRYKDASPPVFIDGINTNSDLFKMMERANAYRENRQAQKEINEQIEKQKALDLTNQVESYYNSLDSYPKKISNGWHKVLSVINGRYCEESKVLVENNQIIKYVNDNLVQIENLSPAPIENGRMMSILNNGNATMAYCYFFEYINNPNSYTSPPEGTGKISFWSNMKSGGNINIYVEGNYIGTLTSYFNNGTPICGQSGTVTFEYKPGTYNYKATNNNGSWSGTISIFSVGDCLLKCLGK